jgi:hypothetical protein
MNKFTHRDWLDIQNAVSNSDLATVRRIRLLDKIEAAAFRDRGKE